MLRSLFSGISGMRSHQTMMDVVANNIANVNTAGFKSSSTVFEDTLSQMLTAAGAPQGTNGGTNPAQVGLGVQVAGVNTNFGQGATQMTGRATDLMIQGDGFFVVNDGQQQLFTRSGAFSFDTNGKLVTTGGAAVMGWLGTNGVVNTNGPLQQIVLPIGTAAAPTATTRTTLAGNLDAAAPAYDAADPATAAGRVVTSIDVYDAVGVAHTLTYEFTKSVTGWSVKVSDDSVTPLTATAAATVDPATGAVTWTPDPLSLTPGWPGATPLEIDLGTVTSFGGATSVAATGQDGSAMGTLQSFTISPDGTIVGVFSNGLKEPLGQVALASFNNAPGLEKVGGSLYRTTVNSGIAQLGAAGTAGRGQLSSGSLEMSNVDLAAEFTNLIVAQRGFQANSRVITTSDEILQDLVNLKR